MTRAIWRVSTRPRCVQVLPASVDLYIPLPYEICDRMSASPEPTYTTFVSDGATATAPIDAIGCESKIGNHVVYCGGAGNGSVTKLVNNMISLSLNLLLGEALALGVKAGVDLKTLVDVIQNSSGATRKLGSHYPHYLFKGNFEPGFALDLGAKDLRLGTNLAREIGLPLDFANLVDQPGFVIGTHAERQNTIRRGARALYASYQATVPWVSVLVRKVYGVAGAGHGNHAALNLRYA